MSKHPRWKWASACKAKYLRVTRHSCAHSRKMQMCWSSSDLQLLEARHLIVTHPVQAMDDPQKAQPGFQTAVIHLRRFAPRLSHREIFKVKSIIIGPIQQLYLLRIPHHPQHTRLQDDSHFIKISNPKLPLLCPAAAYIDGWILEPLLMHMVMIKRIAVSIVGPAYLNCPVIKFLGCLGLQLSADVLNCLELLASYQRIKAAFAWLHPWSWQTKPIEALSRDF